MIFVILVTPCRPNRCTTPMTDSRPLTLLCISTCRPDPSSLSTPIGGAESASDGNESKVASLPFRKLT
jgi:hypothetical protein